MTTSSLSFNTSASTYAIVFQAAVPVFNPNFVPAVVAGSLEVRFYDAVAGRVELEPADVPPRSAPHVLTASLDASNVPRAFLATIYLQCFSYPRQLIFFLTGSFNASLFSGRATWRLPSIDNYFIVDCKSSSEGEDGAVRVSSPRESPMSSGSSLTSSSAGAAAPSAPL